MSIFLVDKIKPIGKFPVFEDRDGYGGFQVRNDASDRDSIPTKNRKPGMLVYTVSDGNFWQLLGGIANTNWQPVTLGSGGGGGGSGISVPSGSQYKVAISNGSGVNFDFVKDANVDSAAAIQGTKILPNFGSQNIITDGYSYVGDGYFKGFIRLNSSSAPPSMPAPPNKGIIYFDSTENKLKASEDGVTYKDLVNDIPMPTGVDIDKVLITRAIAGSPAGSAPELLWAEIGDALVAPNADIAGTKIIPEFGSQNITADGYYSVDDGYLKGFISFGKSSSPSSPNGPIDRGVIYFDTSSNKFKVSENGGAWVDLVKATVYATDTIDGILRLSNDLGGTHDAPKVLKINGASVPETSSPSNERQTGNVLQASGVNSLRYGPVNIEGGDGYISGILPIASGGSPITYHEFSFNSGTFKTNEATYEIVGAILFDKSKLGPKQSGTKTRKIYLKTLMHVVNGGGGLTKGRIVLYDVSGGREVPIKNEPYPSTTRQVFMETASETSQLLISEDLDDDSYLPLGERVYEVRIQRSGGSDTSQVVCLMSKLYVEWS